MDPKNEARKWMEKARKGLWGEFEEWLALSGCLEVSDLEGVPEVELRSLLNEFLFPRVEDGPNAVERAMLMKWLLKIKGHSTATKPSLEEGNKPGCPGCPDSFQEIEENDTHMLCVDWVCDHKEPLWLSSSSSQTLTSSILSLPLSTHTLTELLPKKPCLAVIDLVFSQSSGSYIIEEAGGDAGTQFSLEAWCPVGLLRFQLLQYV
eukprot:TRINITY_DN4274_c0_g9_i1.p1 TRINITY_DN4274_c0_g9~~TRINITY_DN4274_c0_g9_i1.p1  ORF type:complete len:213 (+),score=39.84 TRINITY_DN4274_c0_g9_i1:23-640(+)